MNSRARGAFALSRLLLRKALAEPQSNSISRKFSTLPRFQSSRLEPGIGCDRRWFLGARTAMNDAFTMGFGESSGSESEYDEFSDDERWLGNTSGKSKEEILRKKISRHEQLLSNFVQSATLDEAYDCMKKIDRFESKYFKARPEYRVIGELMERLKNAEGKEKFMLQQKLNRAVKLAEMRERNDPTNPENLGLLERRPLVGQGEDDEKDKEKKEDREEEEDVFEGDQELIEKLYDIDRKLEEKLADLEHTFGKRGKLLEEEIRGLAEERNLLTEMKRRPVFRKGFDVKMLHVNRTVKVTKGGQVVKYSVIVVCGNYNGVVGYAKAKAEKVPVAVRKAHEKCFQNLHTVELYKEHTIPHAVVTEYKKTKLYLWPRPTDRGIKAGRLIEPILQLAGLKDIHSKVIGSRNPFNQVKVVFKALNELESPKDMQKKLGRSVVESYLV